MDPQTIYSPAKFPQDFSPNTPIKAYAATSLQLLPQRTTGQFLNMFCASETPLPALLAAFATTLCRTCGEIDGMFAFRASATEEGCRTAKLLSFNLDNLTPRQLVGRIPTFIRDDGLQSSSATLLNWVPEFEERHGELNTVQTEWQLRFHAGALHGRIYYPASLYTEKTITMFAGVLSRVLTAFIGHPNNLLPTLPLSNLGDLKHWRQWGGNRKEVPDFISVGDCIRDIAQKNPNDVAIVHEDGHGAITYGELDRQSTALAGWLLSEGYGGEEETIIGVWQTRSFMLVIAYLACLKAGCAYMPIEMTLPKERVHVMLTESASPLVLSYSAVASGEEFPCSDSVRHVDLASSTIQHIISCSNVTEFAMPRLSPHRLSSIIFTSGSTGIPKAIMIQHSCLLNFIYSNFKPMLKGDRAAFMLNVAFDVSSGEIWYPLAQGATLVCFSQKPNEPFDVFKLATFLEKERITSVHAPTAIINALSDVEFFSRPLPYLKIVAMGGEAVTSALFEPIRLAKPDLVLTNNYGPSESTIDATTFIIPKEYKRTNVPIGQPLANIGAYVVDDDLNPVPAGVCGELILTGEGLARGYLNQPELTASKFIRLSEDFPSMLGRRGYRTGDLVRLTSDQHLEFVARKDNDQVKLRGYRIELGEIEATIRNYPGVMNALALLSKRSASDVRLVGYFTMKDGMKVNNEVARSIKQHLQSSLPHYMVPSYLLPVSHFTMTRTGKIDRRTMSSPDYIEEITKHLDNGVEEDLTSQQRVVLEIFSKVISIPKSRIGLNDTLFDLGGDSLMATRIINQIRRHYGVVLEMTAFMRNATVNGISKLLQTSRHLSKALSEIIYDEKLSTFLPASDAQARLWVEEQMNPGLSRYNAGFQQKWRGELDIEKLRLAFLHLVERHEALRTTFEMDEPLLMQRIENPERMSINVYDIQSYEGDKEAEVLRLLTEQRHSPFDLRHDLPARFTIIKVEQKVHYVSVTIHHIATDGWSMKIIEKEIAALYNGYLTSGQATLVRLPLRYRDYAAWQRKYAKYFDSQLKYWSEQLERVPPLELPLDFERPDTLSGLAKEIPFEIDADCLANLKDLAARHAASLYAVLLAGFRATLYRVTGEEDGAIGMVNANRPVPEVEGIVGFFVNTHAIRLLVNTETSFDDLIEQSKITIAEALQNADVPFDKVVAHLAPQRQISRNALVQLMFVLQDFAGAVDSRGEERPVGLEVENVRNVSTRLDLSIHLYRKGSDTLQGYLMYQPDLFTDDTILRFVKNFKTILRAASSQPSNILSELNLISPEDSRNLSLWNGTSTPFSNKGSIPELFKSVALREKGNAAIVDGTMTYLYSDVDEISDRVASWLLNQGFCREEVIGIHLGRSALLVIAYLGCLKAGLAYMPLDRGLPLDRIHTMIKSSNCRFVLGGGDFQRPDAIQYVDFQKDFHNICKTQIIELPHVSESQLCNIVYTSGSTGVPKGIMIEHRGMVNLCSPETTNWPGKARNGLTTGVGFDPSGFQIFSTILGGSTLFCLPDNSHFDAVEYRLYLIEYHVQRCSMTPSTLSALMEEGGEWLKNSSLEHLMLGGEKLRPSDIAECHRHLPHLVISSSYGPAEASVRSTYYEVPAHYSTHKYKRIPIGRPLPNTRVYIVNKSMNIVPPGILGEIVVGGVGLARGYLGQIELTESRFLRFSGGHPLGDRIYRTGDLGYWRLDGQLEYVSRNDNQIKIRGQRIEPEEVEAMIGHSPTVKACAVALVKSPTVDSLIAYTVFDTDKLAHEEEVLNLWEDRYNEEGSYGVLKDEAAGHDFARWLSMYNGRPIPHDEMQEWLEDTIRQIPCQPTDDVLEIGVGTGMIALNILGKIGTYVGMDISLAALGFLSAQISRQKLHNKLSVVKGAAHELHLLPRRDFSLAIINSVAQYFPSADYLLHVVEDLLGRMGSHGQIFFGDIRSYSLIRLHDLERAIGTLESDATLDDVRHALKQYASVQTELLLDPVFFYDMKKKFPSIVHVEIRPKLMAVRNELSRYRYTAILHIGTAPSVIVPSIRRNFELEGLTLADIEPILQSTQTPSLGVFNLPLQDLQQVDSIVELVKDPKQQCALPVLRSMLENASTAASTPFYLMTLAKKSGWSVLLDYSNQVKERNVLHAIFFRSTGTVNRHDYVVGDFSHCNALQGESHNNPTKGPVDFTSAIDMVKKTLRKSLPEAMVPNRFIPIKALPLNRSGKLDRRLLASFEYLKSHDPVKPLMERPEHLDNIERSVLSIFARALRCQPEAIPLEESFFNLGGHSLMATSIVSSIRREMHASISMASFFRQPTVKQISSVLRAQIASNSSKGNEQRTESNQDLASTIIVANAEKSSPILFLFPEATGFASVYSSAFSSINCKVIAFGDDRWAQPLTPNDTIPNMARKYVTKILTYQENGPYFLGGWSFGGYLALEVAIQLQSRGKDIASILMFDSSVYRGPLKNSSWRPELDPLLSVVDSRSQWLAQFSRVNSMISAYLIPRNQYAGRILLIKALRGREEEQNAQTDSRPDNGWKEIFPQLRVVDLNSSHRQMFNTTNGPIVGDIISRVITSHEGRLAGKYPSLPSVK